MDSSPAQNVPLPRTPLELSKVAEAAIRQSQQQRVAGKSFVPFGLSSRGWDPEELALWVIYFICIAFLLGALFCSRGGEGSSSNTKKEKKSNKVENQLLAGPSPSSAALLPAKTGSVQMNPMGRKRAEDEARALRDQRRKKQELELRMKGVLNLRQIGTRYWRRTEEQKVDEVPRS